MIETYDTYYCENCGKPEVSSTGNPLYGCDGKNLCGDCAASHIPDSECVCGLCGEKKDVVLDIFLTTLDVKRVCVDCIEYNMKEDTDILIKKL